VDKSLIGVSKRCCPVCTQLLCLLSPDDPIDIRGSHRTIYPCSLPPWLPVATIKDMVTIYERLLLGILRNLVEKSPGARRPSGDSKTASIYSLGSKLPDKGKRTARGFLNTVAQTDFAPRAAGNPYFTPRASDADNRPPEPKRTKFGTFLLDFAATVQSATRWRKKGNK